MCNIQFLDIIINIILALSAISASIFAALTLRQAFKFKQNELNFKRSFFAPSEDPGHLKITEIFNEEPRLLIKFKNYGTNPAEGITVVLLSYNRCDIDGTNQNPTPVFRLTFDAQNPIPSTSEFIIYINAQKLNSVGVSDIRIIMSNYIGVKVIYFDRILSKTFDDQFYWHIEDNGKLFEVTDEYIDNLKKISNQHFKI